MVFSALTRMIWVESKREDKKSFDWWPRMVAVQLFRDYYETTAYYGEPDNRVIDLLDGYFKFQHARLDEKPLSDFWASVLELYEPVFVPNSTNTSISFSANVLSFIELLVGYPNIELPI